jgi:hypothetical protein
MPKKISLELVGVVNLTPVYFPFHAYCGVVTLDVLVGRYHNFRGTCCSVCRFEVRMEAAVICITTIACTQHWITK